MSAPLWIRPICFRPWEYCRRFGVYQGSSLALWLLATSQHLALSFAFEYVFVPFFIDFICGLVLSRLKWPDDGHVIFECFNGDFFNVRRWLDLSCWSPLLVFEYLVESSRWPVRRAILHSWSEDRNMARNASSLPNLVLQTINFSIRARLSWHFSWQ